MNTERNWAPGPDSAELQAEHLHDKYGRQETVLANDLRATYDGLTGFAHVVLYDADDHEYFHLHEDELLSLRDYLNSLFEQKKIPV